MTKLLPATGATDVQHRTFNIEHPTPNAQHRSPITGHRSPPATARRAGFTLVEVLLTSLILGIGLTVLLASLSTCLRTMRLARDYEQVQWVLGLGELAYPEPMETSKDVKTDYTVEKDTSLCEGFSFERVVDEKDPKDEEKDKLYVVRTRVLWGEGGEGGQACEELVRYVWQRDK